MSDSNPFPKLNATAKAFVPKQGPNKQSPTKESKPEVRLHI